MNTTKHHLLSSVSGIARRSRLSGSNNPAAGYTLVEVSVSIAIVASLMTALSLLLIQSSDALAEGLRSSDLDSSLRRVATRLNSDLKDSGSDSAGANYVTSHSFTADTESTTLTFQRRIAFAGTAADWGPAITYTVAPSAGETPGNGADDDGDGVVDEQQITRTQNGEVVVIADGVTGLLFGRLAGEYLINYAITGARRIDTHSEATTRVLASSVALRNKP